MVSWVKIPKMAERCDWTSKKFEQTAELTEQLNTIELITFATIGSYHFLYVIKIHEVILKFKLQLPINHKSLKPLPPKLRIY